MRRKILENILYFTLTSFQYYVGSNYIQIQQQRAEAGKLSVENVDAEKYRVNNLYINRVVKLVV